MAFGGDILRIFGSLPQRSGAVGACEAHNLEAVGSKPTFATYSFWSRPRSFPTFWEDDEDGRRGGHVARAADAHQTLLYVKRICRL